MNPPNPRPVSRRTILVGVTGFTLGLSLRPARAEPPAAAGLTPSDVLYPHDALFLET